MRRERKHVEFIRKVAELVAAGTVSLTSEFPAASCSMLEVTASTGRSMRLVAPPTPPAW